MGNDGLRLAGPGLLKAQGPRPKAQGSVRSHDFRPAAPQSNVLDLDLSLSHFFRNIPYGVYVVHRHQVGAGGADFFEALYQVPGDFEARFPAALFHGVEYGGGDEDTRYLIVQVVRHLEALQGDNAEEDGEVQTFGGGEEILGLPDVVDRLGLDELGSRLFLPFQPPDFLIQVVGAGVGGGADVEVRRYPQLMARQVVAFVQGFRDFDEPRGVHFEDPLRVGVVADGRRIPGEGENVVDPHGVGPQQFRLQADDVPVPAGEVENGFHIIFVLDDGGKGDGAHPEFRHGAVGDVDGVHVGRYFHYLLFRHRRGGALRRVQFRGDGKNMGFVFLF